MIAFVSLFYLTLILLVLDERLHSSILLYYFILGLITFLVYAKDKKASQNNTWRVSEKSLHSLSFLGGWTGAAIAQYTLRHKTQKNIFKAIYWLSVFANIALLTILIIYTSEYLDN